MLIFRSVHSAVSQLEIYVLLAERKTSIIAEQQHRLFYPQLALQLNLFTDGRIVYNDTTIRVRNDFVQLSITVSRKNK